MSTPAHVCLLSLVLAPFLRPVPAGAEPCPDRRVQNRLTSMNRVPVLVVSGTPETIGGAEGLLCREPITKLVRFPFRTLEARGRARLWPDFLTSSQGFVAQMPTSYQTELRACAKSAGIPFEQLVAANVMPDAYRAFGCSSVIVESEHSATDGPLFGRNLDFFTLGTLHHHDVVKVVRPRGKRAFVSIGFPGLVGVLSGMNEDGLALTVHEVKATKDGAELLNPRGMPYTMALRRILEDCRTVADAHELMKKLAMTTYLNVAVCDRRTSAVLEVTPKSVELRPSRNGKTICTNHFRTDRLCTAKECRRFDTLSNLVRKFENDVDVDGVTSMLHAANQGEETLQSMVFEPAVLRLHVSLEGLPSSAGPFRTLELRGLLTERERRMAQ